MNSNTSKNINGYELSENQKNLWKVGGNNPDVFYSQVTLTFNTQIPCDQLQSALMSIVQKHEVLRFKAHTPKNYIFPVQFASEKEAIDYTEIDNTSPDFQGSLSKQLERSYNPSEDLPVRFCVVKESAHVKEVFIRLYALWSDVFSISLFCQELSKAIHINLEVVEVTSEEESIAYVNYAAWQNELIENPEAEAVVFWEAYKPQVGQQIDPFVNKTLNQKFAPQRRQIGLLKGDEYVNFKNNCKNNNVRLEDALLYKYASFLSVFTEDQITIGYAQPKRAYEELNATLGLITKTLPIKLTILQGLDVISGIKEVRKQIKQVENWADYFSLDRKSSESNNNKTLNYSFEYVDIKNYTKQSQNYSGFTIGDFHTVGDVFFLKVSCVDYGDSIAVDIYYDSGKYNEKDIDVLESQLKKYVTNFNLDTSAKVQLSEVENTIITTANATKKAYSNKESILELFEDQVVCNPENIALIYGEKEITYRELNELSDQFATYLSKKHTVVKGDPVCILLQRSDWYVISMLGILKTGAYYIPIDQTYPEDRIKFILQDCKSKLLISDVEEIEPESTNSLRVINPSDETIYDNEFKAYKSDVTSQEVAYCIYTSGSTGNPKGCLVTHGNLVHYIQCANDYYFNDSESGNWALLTSISFDLTVTSLYTSLTRGRVLNIKNEAKDISELLEECFNDPSVDTLKLTPAHVSLLKDLDIKSTHINTIICGGEQLLKNQVDIVRNINPNVRIFNEYGPTETTVGCIVKEVFSEEKIVIGKPIANTIIFIKNANDNLCQVGEVGEIIIGGSGVSLGYFNRDELTREKFIEDFPECNCRVYKTGDLARWLPDGDIEYVGRKDDQVKIRGYRIELGAIEQHLREKEGVIDVVVIATSEENQAKELIAYVVSEVPQSATSLQEHLLKTLPVYMLPSYYVQLKSIPLTVNGKIDKKTLLETGVNLSSGVEYVAPVNEVEEKLVEIWEDIINVDTVGTLDNFFVIGGNSLKAVTVINHIYKIFDVKLQLRDFFKSATIKDIAQEINTVVDVRDIQKVGSNQEFDSEIVI
jgi:amino acid adenylation domain-containing protein